MTGKITIVNQYLEKKSSGESVGIFTALDMRSLTSWFLECCTVYVDNSDSFLLKSHLWAYASKVLKRLHQPSVSSALFSWLAQQRQKLLNLPLQDCTAWVKENVKERNQTRQGKPVFCYVKLIQPKLKENGGNGMLERLMGALDLHDVKIFSWTAEELDQRSKSDKEIEAKEKSNRLQLVDQKKYQILKSKENIQNVQHDEKQSAQSTQKRPLEMESITTAKKQKGEYIIETTNEYLIIVPMPAVVPDSVTLHIGPSAIKLNGETQLPAKLLEYYPGLSSIDHPFSRSFSKSIPFGKPVLEKGSGILKQTGSGIILVRCVKQQVDMKEQNERIDLDI